LAAPLLLALTVGAQPSVTTQHNDNARTGANLRETVLTVANVQRNFGKLFELAVDGDIYAQPLYLQGVNTSKGPKNVVYVATMHNTVYAFDADTGAAFWQKPRSLEPSVQLDGNSDFCQNVHDVVQKEIGIIGTPVISIQNNALYVVAFTGTKKEEYSYYLHALDLLTGAEKFNGPKRIAADGFNSYLQMQRAALLLANGIVYVAFGSYGDCNDDVKNVPFHGWLFGYEAKSLWQVPTVFNTTPNGGQGGIWQAGQGPAADDAGNIYVMSGNGGFDESQHKVAVGNSFIKLQKFLLMTDRFTPWNSKYLSDNDLDLGSGGPLLLPGTDLLIGGGKEGKLYLLRRSNLGGFSSTQAEEEKRIVQEFQATTEKCTKFNADLWPNDPCPEPAPAVNSQGGYHHIHGSPVYWDTPVSLGGPFLYIWGEADRLRRFRFDKDKGRFDTTAVTSPARIITPNQEHAGRGALAVSRSERPEARGNRYHLGYPSDGMQARRGM
jgi:hypothetical protein